MRNGEAVRAFEEAFADYVGARYAVALVNGTATLHTALAAMGLGRGDRVMVPPLTMSSTTLAVLHAGATPVFGDVDPKTWLLAGCTNGYPGIHVSLYGLHSPHGWRGCIDDAAQTLRKHGEASTFTSYSLQASKILSTGEGGVLVTNDEALATRAREFSSLGYRMRADQPRIDSATLKSPTFDRHHSIGWNYRMNDVTAGLGLRQMQQMGLIDDYLMARAESAWHYRDAVEGCAFLTAQHVPSGWQHDYWAFAVACDTPERALWLADAVERHGGERPYFCWKIAWDEPAFPHLRVDAYCPVAESLQPRLLQFQTNNLASAEQNARALRRAIQEAR